MVYAVIAVIIMIFMLLLYGALMLFSDYIKVALYVKAIFINFVWFVVATSYKKYDIYYPSVFENKWFNLLLMTVAIILIVFEISRFVKLRNGLLISLGSVSHLMISIMLLNFCGGLPGWAASIYLTVSSCIVLGIHLATIYGGNHTEPGNIVSRIIAGLLTIPAAFVITGSCLVALSSNNDRIINTLSFNEFIQNLFDFVKNPEFNYSGKLMFSGMEYTRSTFIASLIIAILIFALYIVVDSTFDYRHDKKERSMHRKEAEKERIRAEISSRIHAQLEKIDSCMAYLSSNYKTLKIKDADMKQLRAYYDEATRIKYSYNGAASGPILKRLTEIKTEIFVLRDKILNGYEMGESGEGAEGFDGAGAAEDTQRNRASHEEEQNTGFFNGCKTEEEIKKRYRDLCKVFHPDSENGDQETFLKVKADYEAMIAKVVG